MSQQQSGQQPPAPVQVPPGYELKKKSHTGRNLGIGCAGIIGLFIVIIIATAASHGGSGTSNATSDNNATASSPSAGASKAPAGPTLTSQQQNAARSARQYLSFAAFSRQGLIDQLSSSAGDKYAVQDATIAVDSLNVDWNAEAVQSAKSYLKTQPFSCQGLIDQLDSSAGEKFTVDQATYGAKQAGACG